MDELIIRYLQGEASEAEKEVLLNWLRKNTDNKRTFSQIRDIWLTEREGKETGSAYAHESFLRFTREVEKEERRRKRKSYMLSIRIAATVAILLVCSFGGYWFGNRQNLVADGLDTVVINQVIMGKESKGSVTLPDGTLVWLNENSKLVYPEHFTEDSRKVELTGEAYFEVTHNEKAPFSVETNGMEVKVLGTCFNVRNYGDRNRIETTLLSGKVNVALAQLSEEIILRPNQTLSYDKGNGDVDVRQAEAEEHIIWIHDKLTFSNEKLSDVLRKMKYWYGIDIDCEPGVPMDQRISFVIRKESKDEIFKLLSLIVPVEYTFKQDQVIIRKRK